MGSWGVSLQRAWHGVWQGWVESGSSLDVCEEIDGLSGYNYTSNLPRVEEKQKQAGRDSVQKY